MSRLVPRLWTPRGRKLVPSAWDEEQAAAAVALPLVNLNFENPAEGAPGTGHWTNAGSASFVCSPIVGSIGTLRDTTVKHGGLASCRFEAASSTSFQYAGTAMDLGVAPSATWKFYYRPFADPTSFAHTIWCWGDGVDNRFFFAILPDRKPMVYCRRASSTKFDLRSTVPIALDVFAEFRLVQAAGATDFYVNGVLIASDADDGGVSYSQASFGSMIWGRESWIEDNFCDGYLDDFTITLS